MHLREGFTRLCLPRKRQKRTARNGDGQRAGTHFPRLRPDFVGAPINVPLEGNAGHGEGYNGRLSLRDRTMMAILTTSVAGGSGIASAVPRSPRYRASESCSSEVQMGEQNFRDRAVGTTFFHPIILSITLVLASQILNLKPLNEFLCYSLLTELKHSLVRLPGIRIKNKECLVNEPPDNKKAELLISSDM